MLMKTFSSLMSFAFWLSCKWGFLPQALGLPLVYCCLRMIFQDFGLLLFKNNIPGCLVAAIMLGDRIDCRQSRCQCSRSASLALTLTISTWFNVDGKHGDSGQDTHKHLSGIICGCSSIGC